MEIPEHQRRGIVEGIGMFAPWLCRHGGTCFFSQACSLILGFLRSYMYWLKGVAITLADESMPAG
jgi:hypothetical protein